MTLMTQNGKQHFYVVNVVAMIVLLTILQLLSSLSDDYTSSYCFVSSFTLKPPSILFRLHSNSERLRNEMISPTALQGIRGFRAWFESQFPDAMTAFDHPPTAPSTTKIEKNYEKGSKSNNGKSSSKTDSESFDHVLIDINQLLHITLRRSKSDDHALILLLKELDKCLSIAKPRKSIVLSFDGPPAAAKLATQRRRRFGIIMRNVRRKERINMLIQKGLLLNPKLSNTSSSRKHKKKMRKEEREELTLAITPGTKFMERAEEAVLYWTWQRLSNLRGKMQLQNCRIYISPSSVPGEGEVKLLDWLFQAGNFSKHSNEVQKGKVPIIKRGDSVAIMGGDSDLVLEGLIIPPSITHNVFVILPSGNTKSYAVSLWETTLTLSRFLGSKFDVHDIMKVRTDLVLLLIMNGNDYLPKLRGSSGFNKLFHTYLYLLKNWLSMDQKRSNDHDSKPFFVNPNTLELNLPFCIAFFEALAITAPKSLAQQPDLIPYRQSITPLSQLYSLVDSGLFPGPTLFSQIPIINENGVDKEKEIMKLSLGKNKTSSGNSTANWECTELLKHYYEFDIIHTHGKPLKQSKQLLATIALEELLGKDYLEMNEYVFGNDVQNNDEEDDNEREDNEGDDNEDYDENITDFMGSLGGLGYSWEMETAAPCSVEEYIKGLIWNLATYQDGVCSDYSYNYGRRMSPTADEMLSYFKDAKENGRLIGREELLSYNFTEPLSDGLSCLAALPTEVKHLIPQPYIHLTKNELIEGIYASCMDKDTNVFDINTFRQKCLDHLEKHEIPYTDSFQKEVKIDKRRGRKIRTGKKFWTVLRRVKEPLAHAFEPPTGFSNRLSVLRNDNKVKVYHMHSTERPRWLMDSRWKTGDIDNHKETSKFTDMSEILSNSRSLEDVEYIKVYQPKNRNDKDKRQNSIKMENTKVFSISESNAVELNNEITRMQTFGISPPQPHPEQNTEGLSALQCLLELSVAGFITKLRWSRKAPSPSAYASLYPDLYEEVKLEVKGPSINRAFAQDRKRNLFSRKLMKHHISSMALSYIFFDDDWKALTINEMKHQLSSKKDLTEENFVNIEHRNALQCLHELRDTLRFEITWEFLEKTATSENVKLLLTSSDKEIKFSMEEVRDIYQTSKASSKQSLAASALNQLMGKNNEWTSMTLNQMKAYLQHITHHQ